MTRIPLPGGLMALVDDADAADVVAAGPWHARPGPWTIYVQRNVRRGYGRRTQSLHTFLTGWPLVDHRNGDGLDNQRDNLRQATPSQNAANRRMRRDNTSGFKGVSRNNGRGRPWVSQLHSGGQRMFCGYFDSPEEAARAYDAAALEHFGEFARLNYAPSEVPS